jgi:uncharacterized protein YbaR (Trm112 family)
MKSNAFWSLPFNKIQRSDFVLEVGSGNAPYWRSDLLIDKYVADSAERPGGSAPLVVDRPFVVGDACSLPLKDNSVDFTIARNLLEHIVDADTFLSDMMRVSHKGYITTPSALAEKIFGWSKHIWFVSVDDGILTLRPKQRTLYDASLSKVFHALHQRDKSFQRFYAKNRHLFVVEYYWEESITYQIEGNLEGVAQIKTTEAQFNPDTLRLALNACDRDRSLRGRVINLLHRLVSRTTIDDPIDAIDRLACPTCKGTLISAEEKQELRCSKCLVRYPIIDGIPVLVREAIL